jgi:hypothetical protein
MGSSILQLEQVRKSIQEVYQLPERAESYLELQKAILAWEKACGGKEDDEGRRIFDGLQSLHAFLNNKGLSTEALQIFYLQITVFPELYFPKLPKGRSQQKLDLELFAGMRQALAGKATPEKVRKALTEFEESFRRVNLNLPLLASEIASGEFHRDGKGRAGEFFRSFAEIVTLLQETPARDTPWELMNQLAMKINNQVSGFNQSYLFLKALETIKTARPAGWVRNEIARNQEFFQRNFCWKNIDDAVVARDDKRQIHWIDRALACINDEFERKYLLSKRERAVKRIGKPVQPYIMAGIAVAFVIFVIVLIKTEPETRKSLNLDFARKDLMKALGRGIKDEKNETQSEDPVSVVPVRRFFSRSGLDEYYPPLKPHTRQLTLPEIRHAVFQRQRLDFLKAQNLDKIERERLEQLEREWKARCDFYDYRSEDREAVFWDLKIHGPNLALDAQDILNSWRSGEEQQIRRTIESNVDLDINNSLHLRIILERLRSLGCLTASETPKVWDENCRRALIEFKATHLSVPDSVWDRKTQDALFPRQ